MREILVLNDHLPRRKTIVLSLFCPIFCFAPIRQKFGANNFVYKRGHILLQSPSAFVDQQEVTRTVMASKTIQLFTLCVLALAVEQVVCVGVRVKSLKVKSRPNDYFGEIVTKLRYENEDCYISVRVPVKSQLDERFQVRGNLQFHGLPILRNQVNTLCEALDEKGFFKPIVDKIQPKNKFPGGCPIAAGNYTISNYVINMADYIPVGLIPSGKFEANFLIGQMGSSPIVSIAVTGSVIAERTGLTSFFNFFDTA